MRHCVAKVPQSAHISIMEQFNFAAPAEVFTAKGKSFKTHALAYRRFSAASEALRYAMEELPAELLARTVLEVDEVRYEAEQIRGLYASTDYPLQRPAAS